MPQDQKMPEIGRIWGDVTHLHLVVDFFFASGCAGSVTSPSISKPTTADGRKARKEHDSEDDRMHLPLHLHNSIQFTIGRRVALSWPGPPNFRFLSVVLSQSVIPLEHMPLPSVSLLDPNLKARRSRQTTHLFNLPPNMHTTSHFIVNSVRTTEQQLSVHSLPNPDSGTAHNVPAAARHLWSVPAELNRVLVNNNHQTQPHSPSPTAKPLSLNSFTE